MKPETLLYSLDEVGEDLLAASERPLQERKSRLPAWLAAAAALVFLAGLGYVGWRMLRAGSPAHATVSAPDLPMIESTGNPDGTPNPSTESELAGELPTLSVGLNYPNDMVMESLVYMPSQMREWSQDMGFSGMPVFRAQFETNTSPSDLTTRHLSEAEQLNLIERVLDGMGVAHEIPLTADAPGASFEWYKADRYNDWCLFYNTDAVSVIVTDTGIVVIRFMEGCELPWPAAYENKKNDAQFVRQYWLEQFEAWLRIPGAAAGSEQASDAAKSEDFFVADWVRNVRLELTPNNALRLIRFDAKFQDCYTCLGSYPVISYAEAVELASQGQFFTDGITWENYTFAWDLDNLHYGELMYPAENTHDTLMPFYRFWVRVECIPEDDVPYLTRQYRYVSVFVPAIRSEYLTDFPFESTEDGASS